MTQCIYVHIKYQHLVFCSKHIFQSILKKYKVTQFTQHVLFEENDIKITNNVNAECYVIPYNQVVRVRRKKNLLLFFAKDYHLIAVDQSGIPFGGQNELFHSIFEKMPQAARWGIK